MPTAPLTPIAAADLAAHEWTLPLNLKNPSRIPEAVLEVVALFGGEISAGDSSYSVTDTGRDVAFVDLQPGDGTVYRMLIVLLSPSAADSLGYRLVISFPDFGACLALDAFGFHVPHYIAEKAPALGPRGAAVIAAFTTQLSAHLDNLLNP